MTSARSLYLPVESLARELDGKLLLALVARERGWRPVVGYKAAIRSRRAILPPGIVLAHNARTGKAVFFERFGRFGHQSAVLDEEALVRQTDDIFLMKHEKNAFDHVDLLLAWGEDDADLWRRSQRIPPDRIAATGNPRIDMLRSDLRAFHQPEIDAIRARTGDYVLLNTNFATVNHYVPWSSTLNLASWVTDARIIEQKDGLLAHKRVLLQRFLQLVPKIAEAVAPLKLIVRPHPSELHQPWHDAVSGSANASVVFEGSVVPWIAGARALIHNGCTSAVESAVIGTTVLTYRPVQSEVFDNPLPNGVGTEYLDDDALVGALREIATNGPRAMTADQLQLLEHHVAGASGRLSCERIIDAFEKLPPAGENMPAPGQVEMFKRHLKVQWRAKSRRLTGMFSTDGRKRLSYADRKFPEITADQMDTKISRFQASLGRFQGLKSRRLATNLFAIE